MANLTGEQIVQKGIVTKVTSNECIQQVGVDLELIKVAVLLDHIGFVPKEGKTQLAKRSELLPTPVHRGFVLGQSSKETKSDDIIEVWFLNPGVYDITFAQGCKIPADERLQIIQRSSVLRNGSLVVSSMFDPGFETENIGTILHVRQPIYIEVGARIAQAYTTRVNEVKSENLYNGQWQNDQQRNS